MIAPTRCHVVEHLMLTVSQLRKGFVGSREWTGSKISRDPVPDLTVIDCRARRHREDGSYDFLAFCPFQQVAFRAST